MYNKIYLKIIGDLQNLYNVFNLKYKSKHIENDSYEHIIDLYC